MKFTELRRAYLDFETTGFILKKDEIVETAIVTIEPNSKGRQVRTYSERYNPGFHIPTEVSRIHKIYDKDVVGKPKFEEKLDEMLEFISGVEILIAYNGMAFDRPFVINSIADKSRQSIEELPRALSLQWIDPFLIFQSGIIDAIVPPGSRTLTAMCKAFGVNIGRAHSAEDDTIAMAKMFEKIVGDILPDDIDKLEELTALGLEKTSD